MVRAAAPGAILLVAGCAAVPPAATTAQVPVCLPAREAPGLPVPPGDAACAAFAAGLIDAAAYRDALLRRADEILLAHARLRLAAIGAHEAVTSMGKAVPSVLPLASSDTPSR